EAERLESLRKSACNVGGDAVIEAVNEEVRNEQAQYVLVSSGTAVIWVRPKTGEVKPLTTHKKPKKDAAPDPSSESSAEPPTAPVTTAAPAPTPTPAAPTAAPVPTATAVASAAPTAAASAAPTASPVKSKLPTNAAPKPLGKQGKKD